MIERPLIKNLYELFCIDIKALIFFSPTQNFLSHKNHLWAKEMSLKRILGQEKAFDNTTKKENEIEIAISVHVHECEVYIMNYFWQINLPLLSFYYNQIYSNHTFRKCYMNSIFTQWYFYFFVKGSSNRLLRNSSLLWLSFITNLFRT